MIQHSIILRISRSRLFFLVCSLLFLTGELKAQFRNEQDREIVRDILKTFARACSSRVATDGDILRRINLEVTASRKAKNPTVQSCIDSFYSQITGVYVLYQKLCSEVTDIKSTISDDSLAYDLLEVNKYQSGIRPLHSSMNDCLMTIPERKGRAFIVPLAGNELDVKVLQQQILETRIDDPFPATGEPLR